MASSASNALRFKGSAMLAMAVAMAVATQAHAKVQDNCRRITIEGAAGNLTNAATWSIYDNDTPPNRLVESCLVQPQPDETNLQYIRRLGYRWGDASTDPVCPAVDDTTEASNRCLVDSGGLKSCRIKSKISPKSDGSKKRYVEFCCYADPDCGDKLADPIPITVVVDRDGVPESCPADNCVDDCSDCTVDVDPIAMRNLPTGPGAACRDAIARAVNSYTSGTTAVMTACHTAVTAGQNASNTDCNSVTVEPNLSAVLPLAPIVDEATTACAVKRTPVQMGYGTCAAPCESIAIGQDWANVADCLRCQAEHASIATVEAVYGPTPAPATSARLRSSTDAIACQAAVGEAITSVASVRAQETAGCQKKVDAGAALPAGVASCKANDAKGRIEQAEASAGANLGVVCTPLAVTELALCSGAADAAAVAGCVGQAAEVLNDSVADVAVPSGTKCLACTESCGDGEIDFGESCDAGNLAGKSCIGEGFVFGTLACDTACALDSSGCSSAGVTDQVYTLTNNGGTLEITANQAITQTFTVGTAGQLVRLDVPGIRQNRCTPVDDLRVMLVTATGGAPSATVLATRIYKPGEVPALGGPVGTLQVDISSFGVTVASGDVFGIRLETDAPGGGCDYTWNGDSPAGYAAGSCFLGTPGSPNSVRDMAFGTWVLP